MCAFSYSLLLGTRKPKSNSIGTLQNHLIQIQGDNKLMLINDFVINIG